MPKSNRCFCVTARQTRVESSMLFAADGSQHDEHWPDPVDSAP
jgi:hypothetical protein